MTLSTCFTVYPSRLIKFNSLTKMTLSAFAFQIWRASKAKTNINLERESKRNPKGKNKIFYLQIKKKKKQRGTERERETKRKEKKQRERERGPLITFAATFLESRESFEIICVVSERERERDEFKDRVCSCSIKEIINR